MAGGDEARVRVRVGGGLPLALLLDVAVAARRELRLRIIVAQEAGGGVRRRVEELAVPKDDLVVVGATRE